VILFIQVLAFGAGNVGFVMKVERVLSQEQIDTFLEHGVLVVDNILSESQVKAANEGLSRTLAEHGVDVQHLESTGHALRALSSTNGSGGVLDLFYPEWKMKVAGNPRLFHATSQLWQAAYCHDGETREELDEESYFKWHPYGPFDCKQGFMYIDRIGYRIPTAIAKQLGSHKTGKNKPKPLQRSLTPHLDCCPNDLFSATASKWRPIQCFVSLTDNLEPNTGGFEAALGFHKDFHKWKRPGSTIVKKSVNGRQECLVPAPCIGEYTHIRPKEDAYVMERIQHVPVRAGSAVFWDNRIPHANAYRNDSENARAVVYCSFLPNIQLNREYVKKQLFKLKRRIPPTDQWINNTNDKHGVDEMLDAEHDQSGNDNLTDAFQRNLLGVDPW
jgi:hypothetical protein